MTSPCLRRTHAGSPALRDKLAHRRRRASERGAALVEAAIAIPVFIVLLLGMLFLHDVVANTQKSQLAARDKAWTAAMASCKSGPEITQPDLTSRMSGAAGSEASLSAVGGEATGSDDAQVKVSTAGSGPSAISKSGGSSFLQGVRSKVSVMCNATTAPGDIPQVLHWFVFGSDLGVLFGGP
jgi:Tfp pilus assembly protein PilV